MTNKILFVDDEPAILRSYKRYVGLDYEVDTAVGGESALKMLDNNGPYGVVVSDMRMPGMSGAEFLTVVRENYPESVRMLLTGQADMEDTIKAVNDGQIYRFLTKPCPPETLGQALDEGLELYRLRRAEKELLEQTLQGAIKVMGDILSLVSPVVFSRSSRVGEICKKLAAKLGYEDTWKIEVATALANIGSIAVPQEILEKYFAGENLTSQEAESFYKYPKVGKDLLVNIPRMEEIAAAIYYQEKHWNGGGFPDDEIYGENIPLIARMLKVANDFDFHKSLGKSNAAAVSEMFAEVDHYDPEILGVLKSINSSAETDPEATQIIEIRAKQVKAGMLLAEGVRTKGDLLLAPAKQEVSPAMMMCIHNFAANRNIIEPIRIIVQE